MNQNEKETKEEMMGELPAVTRYGAVLGSALI